MVAPSARAKAAAREPSITVFSGRPSCVDGDAVLFDSAQEIPGQRTISRISVQFAGRHPAPREIDRGLVLLIYVDDLALPRARIRLADLIRQGGSRPLNLRKDAGQVVRIVLSDTNGVWASGAPEITVSLAI